MYFKNNIILKILVLFLLNHFQIIYSVLYGRCSLLNDKLLTRLCTAKYPKIIKMRYMDNYVKPDLEYAIFKVIDQDDHYFITHSFSEIFNCTKKLKINGPRHLQCEENIIELKSAILICLQHRTYVADELIDHCTGLSNTQTKFVAMHYNNPAKLLKDSANESKQLEYKLNIKLYLFHILWFMRTLLIRFINE